MTYQTTTIRWINISDDGGLWVRVDQIESVFRQDGRVVVQMISGQQYKAGRNVSLLSILKKMGEQS